MSGWSYTSYELYVYNKRTNIVYTISYNMLLYITDALGICEIYLYEKGAGH